MGEFPLVCLSSPGADQATQVAWEAAKFMVQNFSVEWAVKMGHVPALLEAAESPEYTNVKEMQGFRDSIPYTVYLPKVPQHEEISGVMWGNLSAALQGAMGVQEALDDAEAKVSEILAG